MNSASVQKQLTELLDRGDAKSINALAEHCAAMWYPTVKRLRAEWLSEPSAKTAKQYARLYRLLTEGQAPAAPGDLLKRAATLTASPATLRAYRAAIKYIESREHVRALRAVLDKADDAREAAVKAAGSVALLKAYAGCVHLAIYDNKLAPVAAKLDAIAQSIDGAKAGLKPSGIRNERSHCQRSKLWRLPDDWMLRMLERMSKGRGRQAPKYAQHAAAVMLTGARPQELDGMSIRREGSALVIVANGAKHSKTRGAIKATTGRKTRTWVLDPSTLDPQRAAAFAKLNAEVDAGGLTLSDGLRFADAWKKAAQVEFGKLAASVYAVRHQFASDLKETMEGLTGPALEAAQVKLADALGHASTKTQTVYGRARYGRSGSFTVGVSADGCARVARPQDPGGRRHAAQKRAAASKIKAPGLPPPSRMAMRGPR